MATTTTLKQPFRGRLRKALETAVSYTWDGCHKIYILGDEEAHEAQEKIGYACHRIKDVDEALEEVSAWWSISCGLRFICRIDGDLYEDSNWTDVIGQFEYEKEEDADD